MTPGQKGKKPPFLAAFVSFALSGLFVYDWLTPGLTPWATFFGRFAARKKPAGESPAATQLHKTTS
jgi:hypothetical protein